MEDPDGVWRQVRELEAAWDGLLRRVRAGELTGEEASAEIRALLWAAPEEVLAMGARWLQLRHGPRRGREGR